MTARTCTIGDQAINRVAITGLGAISALGHDVAALWAGARAGGSGIGPIANIPTERLTVRIAGEVRGFDPAAHFAPRRVALLDRSTQFALVAAREAVADASLPATDPRRSGVVLGGAIGQETFDAAYKSLYGDGLNRVHPFTVPRIMPNASTSHVGMEFGFRGPSFAAASACASANHAIGLAAHLVRSGLLDVVITGASDASIVVGFVKGWEALRVLSQDTCRPFSRNRGGLVLGEGAGILVLESFAHAEARGARILAELAGFGMSADAGDLTAPDEEGAAAAMQAALDDAGLPPGAVDYVNAHGTGTRLNDRTEVAALRRVFGGRVCSGRAEGGLPVSSTKSMIGHCLTACGALELIVTIMALRENLLPPTIGFLGPDPECPVDCVPGEARPAPIHVALSNSFAFGGLNAVLVVRRPA